MKKIILLFFFICFLNCSFFDVSLTQRSPKLSFSKHKVSNHIKKSTTHFQTSYRYKNKITFRNSNRSKHSRISSFKTQSSYSVSGQIYKTTSYLKTKHSAVAEREFLRSNGYQKNTYWL
jgi:hypothetical protein